MKLFKNIGWAFFGNLVYAFCQWSILIVLAKITDPQKVGQFALAIAITGPIFSFSNLQIRTIQATDISGSREFSLYMATRLISSTFALIAILAISIFASDTFSTFIIIVIYGIAKYIKSLSDCIYGFLQRHELMDKISQSMILRSISSLMLMSVIIVVSQSLAFGIFAYFFSWAAVFLLFDLPNARKVHNRSSVTSSLRPNFDLMAMSDLFMFALPLAIIILLNSLSTNVPRYVIAMETGNAELGYFAAIAAFMVVGGTIVNAIGQASLPRLAGYVRDDTRRFVQLFSMLLAATFFIGVAGVFVAWVFGEWVLRIVYTPAYAAYSDLLVWTMIASLILYLATMVGVGLAATRQFKAQAVVTSISTLIVLIASMTFIPIYGIVGGAIALCCGFACKFFGQILILVHIIVRSALPKASRSNCGPVEKRP